MLWGLILAAVCTLYAPRALAEEAPQADILLVTDPWGPGDVLPRAQAVQETLIYMARSFDTVDTGYAGSLEGYARVIIALDAETSLGDALADALRETDLPVLVIGPGGLDQLTDRIETAKGAFEASYEISGDRALRWLSPDQTLTLLTQWDREIGGTIGLPGGQSRPLCASDGRIASLPWLDASSATMRVALANLMTQWMWPYENEPWSYATYLVLEDVYPFEDLEKLMAITDMMAEQRAPYAISVMPVYDNGHYPAMKRFCEYLRYAQSKGAAILLRTPLATLGGDVRPEDLLERLGMAYEAYVQYGVYPVGLTAPKSYLFSEAGLSVLRGSRVVALFDTDEPMRPQRGNLSYADGHFLIAPANAQGMTNAYSNAVYLNVNEDVETLRAQVAALTRASNPVRSLWQLSSAVYLGERYAFTSNPNGETVLNGERVDLTYRPFDHAETFDYQRGFMQFLTGQMKVGNKLILLLVTVSMAMFLGMILTARRAMRRQFLVAPREQQAERGIAP